MIQGKEQKAVYEMALPILKEINNSVETLLDLMVAWTNKDFKTALSKIDLSLEHIDKAGEAVMACTVIERFKQEDYMTELREVKSLIGSFEPFLLNKAQSVA